MDSFESLFPIKAIALVFLLFSSWNNVIESLRFFFPRMVKGGIILIHDFHSDGIQKAFKEFKNENEMRLIELTGSQAMVIKD